MAVADSALFVALEHSLERGLVTAIGIEVSSLLGCDAVLLAIWLPTFRKFAPPCSAVTVNSCSNSHTQ
jgi:hypothetical protein